MESALLAVDVFFLLARTVLVLAIFLCSFALLGMLGRQIRKLIWYLKVKRGYVPGWDNEYTGSYPRYMGAKSVTNGGHPEDMNEMPAVVEPGEKNTIYDGSDIPPPHPKAA